MQRKRNTGLKCLPPIGPLYGMGVSDREALVKFTVQRHWLKERLRLNQGTIAHFLSPTLYHYITNGFFYGSSFYLYIISSFQQKITKQMAKKQTNKNRVTRQEALELMDMAEMLELSD